jgi:hypothetical protein
MVSSNKSLDIKLRLNEINRRFAQLSAVSSRLADMAEQLDRLRKVNERIGIFSDRSIPSRRRRNGHYFSGKCFGEHRLRIPLPAYRDHFDER